MSHTIPQTSHTSFRMAGLPRQSHPRECQIHPALFRIHLSERRIHPALRRIHLSERGINPRERRIHPSERGIHPALRRINAAEQSIHKKRSYTPEYLSRIPLFSLDIDGALREIRLSMLRTALRPVRK